MKENKLEFETLVEICDLNPTTVNDWKSWTDLYGNKVRISNNHNIRIYPSRHPDETKTNDVFFKALPHQMAKHSYWVMLISDGKNNSLTYFLGDDGKLRVSYYENGTWKANFPPLLSGLEALRIITRGYMDPKDRSISPIPPVKFVPDFKPKKCQVSGWPTKNEELRGKIQCLVTRKDMKG